METPLSTPFCQDRHVNLLEGNGAHLFFSRAWGALEEAFFEERLHGMLLWVQIARNAIEFGGTNNVIGKTLW